jgi:SAM-dependent methyltransferase
LNYATSGARANSFMIRDRLKAFAKRILPAPSRRWLRLTQVRVSESPAYKCVRFGSLRRTTPIHDGFSFGRGTYIDRYYIEGFLRKHAPDIRGRVLELSDNEYTVRFGGEKVTQSDVLDVRPDHAPATIIADLTSSDGIPSNAFDCIILTQTLNVLYDVRAAVRTTYRILKPGGCVLVSVSGIAQIAAKEMEYCGDYWRFTHLSLRRLFEESFPSDSITVESHGNVLTAVAFLHGLAAEELTPEELDYRDPNFEVSVLLRAVKPNNDASLY